MNREDIIRMAREAGFTDHNGFCEVIVRHSNGSWIGVKDELERFAALVAAAEREACEALHQHEDVVAPVGNSAWGEAYQEGWAAGTSAYRDAIRTRSKQ